MATAIAAGTMLAGGASAVAGFTGATVLGMSAATLGTIAAVGSLAGAAFSGIQQSNAQKAAGEAALLQSQQQADQLQLKIDQEKTQSALQEAERQRRLKRVLASQRAAFAGGGIDPFSGSPVTIDEDTQEVAERSSNRAKLTSDIRSQQLNANRVNTLAAGRTKRSTFRKKSRQTLLTTATQVGTGLSNIEFSDGE